MNKKKNDFRIICTNTILDKMIFFNRNIVENTRVNDFFILSTNFILQNGKSQPLIAHLIF